MAVGSSSADADPTPSPERRPGARSAAGDPGYDAGHESCAGVRPPVWRFTIRSVMIVVAILAGVLALPPGPREVAAVLSVPCLAFFGAWRLWVGGHRRLAAIVFWSLAIAANIVFAAFCASPGMVSVALLVLWLFVVMPSLVAFGATWAELTTGRGGVSDPSRRLAWRWVIALAVMPGMTAWTVWPFRLRFLTVRSALERIADQVEAGQAVSFPQDVGPFRLAGSRVGSRTGGVALLIDPNPNGPSGFVRHKDSLIGPYDCYDPIRGDVWHVGLGGGWCYHEED
jgi:hypothetical protein